MPGFSSIQPPLPISLRSSQSVSLCLTVRCPGAVLFQVSKHPFACAAQYKAVTLGKPCSSVRPALHYPAAEPLSRLPRPSPPQSPHLGKVLYPVRRFLRIFQSGSYFQEESHLDTLLVSRFSEIALSNVREELFHVIVIDALFLKAEWLVW